MDENTPVLIKETLYDKIFKPQTITLANGHSVRRRRSRAPLIVLRGLASQPGGIFQSLAHIGPAVPAKVAALVQHGRRHLIPQTVGILSQLRFASGRKLTDICFVFLKNKSVLARRRFFGR